MSENDKIEQRVLFHGNAVALAAHIRRPDDFFVPATASSCLPVTGGFAENSVPGQNFRDLISFDSAWTRASGDYSDRQKAVDFTHTNFADNTLPAETMVACSVKNFKIAMPAQQQPATPARTFTAEQLFAHQVTTVDRQNPTSFRSLEVAISGIAIDGHVLIVKTNPNLFSECDTIDKLRQRYATDKDFRQNYARHFFMTGDESQPSVLGRLFGAKDRIPESDGLIVGTLVTNISWLSTPAPGCEILGHQVKIDGLGSIFFAEIIIEESFRRLTLVRFQLGSPYGGDGSACEVQSNSDHWPPRLTGSVASTEKSSSQEKSSPTGGSNAVAPRAEPDTWPPRAAGG